MCPVLQGGARLIRRASIRSASGKDTVDPYPSINNLGDVAISGNSTSYAVNPFGIATDDLQVQQQSGITRTGVATQGDRLA